MNYPTWKTGQSGWAVGRDKLVVADHPGGNPGGHEQKVEQDGRTGKDTGTENTDI